MAILLLTGPSATGKTTIARKIGNMLEIPVVGEREILRGLAHSHGFTRTRYWLKEVGVDVVLDEALSETVRKIQEERGERGVILDGSYDRRLPQVLQEVLNEGVFIISVITEESIRKERIKERMGVSFKEAEEEMRLIDAFKYYAGMREIMEEANLTIENNRLIDEVVREFQLRLESEIFPGPSCPERIGG